MNGPWDKFKSLAPAAAPAAAGPWTKFQSSPAQSDAATPPPGLTPGSREYADWAATEARAGKTLPQVSATPPSVAAPPPMNGPLDKIQAAYTGAVDSIPIIGEPARKVLESAKAAVYHVPTEQIAAEDQSRQDQNPISTTLGRVAGTVVPLLAAGEVPVVRAALGMEGNLAPRIIASTISGAGINGADTLVRGGTPDEIRNSAIEGGALGAALPAVASIARGAARFFKAPAEVAPSGAALKADAGVGYDAARATGAQFKPTAFSPLHSDLSSIANQEGAILPNGKTAPGFNRVKAALKATEQYAKSEGPVTLQQQATLRRILQNAAESNDKVESRIGSKMLDAFDGFFDNLPDAAFVGESAAGPAAMASIAKARGAYAQAMRVRTFEGVVDKAKRAGGGDAAYRTAFSQFLGSARKTRGFPPEQLAAIDAFVKGGPIRNLIRTLSAPGSVPSAVAGGFTGGPAGAAAGFVGPPLLKAATGRAAAGQAEALRGAVAGAPPQTVIERWLNGLNDLNSHPARIGPAAPALSLTVTRGHP